MNGLQVVEQKLVNFNGAEIMGVRTNDGKVHAGLTWVCEGIGLTEGQIKNERKRVQEDLVLKQGGRNLVLPTKGGLQEVLVIEIDFLPLWLAKISITPKMQQESPEVTENLIQYQLKAKDVLAAEFIGNQQPIVLTAEQQRREHLKLSIGTSERVDIIEEKLDSVINTMRIDGVEQQNLKLKGGFKVMQALGGKNSNAYHKISRRMFKAIWGEFNKYFNIPRYSELPKVNYEEGLKFIALWQPSTALRMEIEQHNRQIQLKIVR